MPRPKLPESEKRQIFNVRIAQVSIDRINEISRRVTVARRRKFSQSRVVEVAVRKFEMPRKPTPEQEAEWERIQRNR